jgi:hypothetical protein
LRDYLIIFEEQKNFEMIYHLYTILNFQISNLKPSILPLRIISEHSEFFQFAEYILENKDDSGNSDLLYIILEFIGKSLSNQDSVSIQVIANFRGNFIEKVF